MKKLFFAVAAILFATSANAQVGIIAGVTSSSNDYEEAWASAKDVTQYHIGVGFKLPLPFGFAVQPSVIYNVKGARLEDAATSGDLATMEYKTGLLEIPVQAQWGVNLFDAVRPYVFAEPFVGYAINNEVKVSNLTGDNSKEEWDNVKNRLEYGVGVGFGVEILGHLQVSVRKYWNMGNLYSDEGAAVKSFKEAINKGSSAVEEGNASGIMASVAILF